MRQTCNNGRLFALAVVLGLCSQFVNVCVEIQRDIDIAKISSRTYDGKRVGMVGLVWYPSLPFPANPYRVLSLLFSSDQPVDLGMGHRRGCFSAWEVLGGMLWDGPSLAGCCSTHPWAIADRVPSTDGSRHRCDRENWKKWTGWDLGMEWMLLVPIDDRSHLTCSYLNYSGYPQ